MTQTRGIEYSGEGTHEQGRQRTRGVSHNHKQHHFTNYHYQESELGSGIETNQGRGKTVGKGFQKVKKLWSDISVHTYNTESLNNDRLKQIVDQMKERNTDIMLIQGTRNP